MSEPDFTDDERAQWLADEEVFAWGEDSQPAFSGEVSAPGEAKPMREIRVLFDRVPHWHGVFNHGTIDLVWYKAGGTGWYRLHFHAKSGEKIKPLVFAAPGNSKPRGRAPDEVEYRVLQETDKLKWRLKHFGPNA